MSLDPRIYAEIPPRAWNAARRYGSNFSGLGEVENGAGIFDSAGTEGWGARFWEWMNPEQVRREYEMQGKTPPPDITLADVLTTAREQARETASEAGKHLATGFNLAKTAVVIGAGLYAFHLLNEFRKRR